MKNEKDNLVKSICSQMIENIQSNKQPLCILIGGLPGAGKTNLIEQVKKEHPDREFLVIDADDFRKLHPDNDKLLESPEKAVTKTIAFANSIELELIKQGIERKLDIISVTSLRATDVIDQILYRPAIDSGYKIEACIMSVPISECGLSAQNRYEEQIKKGQFPRFVSMDFMDSAYSGIKNTILMLQRKSDKPVIKIYKRGEQEKSMPIKYYDSTDQNILYRSALEGFMNPKKSIKKETASFKIKELYEKKKQRGADVSEYKALERLEELFGIDEQVR